MPISDMSTTQGDRATLRERIEGTLKSNSDFDAFCLDHFPSVYRRFSDGMNRVQKENELLVQADHAAIRQALDKYAKDLARTEHVVDATPQHLDGNDGRQREHERGSLGDLLLAELWRKPGRRVAVGCALAGVLVFAVAPSRTEPTPVNGTVIPPIEPFAAEALGVVLGGPWVRAGKGERLEKELKAHDPKHHAVRSVPFAQRDSRDSFFDVARNAGAAVIVTVDGGGTAFVYPQGRLANDPLFRGPLEISVANQDEQVRAAALINGLARLAGSHPDGSVDGLPCPDLGTGQFDRATLLTLLVVPACWAEPIDPRRYAGICGTPPSYQDEPCALALYLDPTSSRETLETLSTEGPWRFRPVAKLRLTEADCKDGHLDRATEAVLDLSNSLDLCRQIELPPIASCILTKSKASTLRSSRPDVEAIEARQIVPQAGCSERQRALALAHRAYWRGQRGQWQLAAGEYGEAYDITREPAHAFDQAEAWLHQGSPAVAKQALDRLPAGSGPREQQAKAALLLWVAGRQAKNAGWLGAAQSRLLGLSKGHEGEAALSRGEADDVLRQLVCPPARGPTPRRLANGAAPPCLYDLLRRPTSSEELKASFGAP